MLKMMNQVELKRSWAPVFVILILIGIGTFIYNQTLSNDGNDLIQNLKKKIGRSREVYFPSEQETPLFDQSIDRLLKYSEDAMHEDDMQERNGLLYAPNSETPYSGWGKTTLSNGRVGVLMRIIDGKMGGFMVEFHENGQVAHKFEMKNGQAHGRIYSWYPNGGISKQLVGVDGKILDGKVWRPDGTVCPASNLKSGFGVIVAYNNHNNIEAKRTAYRDGVPLVQGKVVKSFAEAAKKTMLHERFSGGKAR